jgi:multidrug efflux pump subunit AcrA (membrane-fusion protein)
MDTSQVIAKAHIPQEQAQVLKVGDPATLTVPGEEKPVEGKVTVVSPALDPNSTTVEVWVLAKNPEQRLKPGSNVQLSMVAQVVPNALVVPASALLTAPDGARTAGRGLGGLRAAGQYEDYGGGSETKCKGNGEKAGER